MPATISRLLTQLRSLHVRVAVEPTPRIGPSDWSRARRSSFFAAEIGESVHRERNCAMLSAVSWEVPVSRVRAMVDPFGRGCWP